MFTEKNLNNFKPDIFRAKGIHEQRMCKVIRELKEPYFFLDFFVRSGSQLEKSGLFMARRELIKNGLCISVLTKDALGYGITKFNKEIRDVIDKQAQAKLLCISYQSIRVPLKLKYPELRDDEVWRDVWIDTYNNWIKDYLPKIISHL